MTTKSKSRILRDAMADKGLVHIMASHAPLSARLAEEAGFDGVWASGFELSALYGLPDVSLVSMTQHLDMMRAMSEQMDLPIVADIDTGFGNAVNVIYAVEQYEAAGAAAVVIEEFQGKIEAACKTRKDPDFLIVARDEALIAGLGEPEALKRAAAYEEAGADMILIHSKKKTPDEVESFVNAWHGRAPVVIVPTAYPEMNAERIRALGKIRMVIYGNHAIRASVTAMQKTFSAIIKDGGIQKVNEEMVSVEEIFRLQRMDRVKAQERAYLR